ncbi:MAG: peptidylprolyl isomerase [Burkholderiaceae bacterium]|jgi:peptidyl-prolyl cis-trans isomerase C|nr:peptidylprolyl isomerase [Burkholderiaceae bacterium]
MLSFPKFSVLVAALAASMLSLSAARAQTAVPAASAAALSLVVVSGPAGQITQEEVEVIVRDLVPLKRQADFWVDTDALKRLARDLYTQRALAAQAGQTGLDKSPRAQTYFKLLRERALTTLLMDDRAKAAQPDEQALVAYAQSEYRARPERFALPEEIHARHILIAVAKDGSDDAQARAKAEALLNELRKGADFGKLAQEISSDKGSAQRGGDLGFFARGKMVAPFEQAAFDLQKPGDLAGPVKTQYGYHIIELLERKPAATKKFEDVLTELKKEIAAKIENQQRQQLWEAADASAQIDDASLQALAERHAQGGAQKLPEVSQ